MKLSDNSMWEAVKQNDKRYDHQFYYAVKTTKIVCNPSCTSKTPKRDNVRYYPTLSQAIHDGFRPCKRCRPDLVDHSDYYFVEQVSSIFEKKYMLPLTLDQVAHQIGYSKYHLLRLYKKVTGKSLMSDLTFFRIQKSIELLLSSSFTITQIAYDVGYQSTSQFNVVFKRKMGCTPSIYRQRERI
ncbi:bifunctional transcriptional activator/DNA repair enzyme AdaA [Terrilactibacillus laevilacticus]|uniref:bifunctional transcriptional activator/DNA repair enzyme AdaA n=1 Tax=Terrilactibacillus laevilacticus TaxID=1380157 RepID=UPI0011478909|nr:Ada metal-binding domain-containing protein [Terrilactibacillus laevilacticus]